jgi:NAD(P)-dependent dehydrogenase (short-subunit alcohol dehydrogenase family)
MSLFFGAKNPAPPRESAGNPAVLSPLAPVDLALSALKGQCGAVGFAGSAEQAASFFPFAALSIGPRPVQGLLALSRLVGMICPGLHSIFARLDVSVVDGTETDFVSYKVTRVDERVRYVTQAVHGAGLSGTVEAFARKAPAEQMGIAELAKTAEPNEFRGAIALVVGGSRGLGELTAKLLAAGGAHVIISYSVGCADADRVASSIRAAGRTCEVIHYDVRNTSADQLGCLASIPTYVYYFATGPISRTRTRPFDSRRFDEFCAFYVKGFAHLCSSLRLPEHGAVRVFCPSSAYVSTADRPMGFAEYAMAKAAAEMFSRRLPRMQTDQTASLLPGETYSPSDAVMMAVIREMQASAPLAEPALKSSGAEITP